MVNYKLKGNIFKSSILLFLLGSLLHFAYDFLNNNFIVGLITPINESVWEHLKLAVNSIPFWWVIFYLIKKEEYNLNKGKWFLGCLISITVSIITIVSIFYFTRYGLNVKSTIIDIASLYIALLLGQLTGYHIYKYSRIDNCWFSIILIYIVIVSFMILTIVPPKLPLFEDPVTRTYGIYKQKKN